MSRLFDWNAANITHIADHDVLPDEAEEVVLNNPLDVDYIDYDGELRIRQVGETVSGRILVVVTTERVGLLRVVTAYEPSGHLRSKYLKFKESWVYGKAGHT